MLMSRQLQNAFHAAIMHSHSKLVRLLVYVSENTAPLQLPMLPVLVQSHIPTLIDSMGLKTASLRYSLFVEDIIL